MTVSERKLWAELRGDRLSAHFRRQVPVRHFIVDFLVPAARLIVEVDGGYHERRCGADERREQVLGRLGYRVLRLEAEFVMRNMPEALARIRAALAQEKWARAPCATAANHGWSRRRPARPRARCLRPPAALGASVSRRRCSAEG